MPKYAMVIDQRRCVACMACVVACKNENDVPPEQYRTRVLEIVEGEFPQLRMELRSELCNHCDNPPCVYNCPTGASYKRKEDGIVLLRKNRCVGCKACVAACPYDARYINHEKGFADKCTFCIHRVEKGQDPACVSVCPTRCMHFGDADDPHSEVSRLLASRAPHTLLPEAGTKPRIYYLS